MSRIRPVLVKALFALSLAALWLLYAPAAAGGGLRLVTVSGTSMNPLLHGGDMVFVRPTGSYEVGDVLLYRADSGATYLHRAVREEGGRLVFQGDNNSWEDSSRVSRGDVIGEMVGHIPGAGRLPGGPRLIPILAILAASGTALSLLRGSKAAPGRRRSMAMKSELATRAHQPRPAAPPRKRAFAAFAQTQLGQGLLNAAAAAAVVGAGLLLFGFSGPVAKTVPASIAVQHTGTFSFAGVSAGANVGGIETNGTNGPVFFRTAETLAVTYRYAVTAEAPVSASTETAITASLRADNGWTAPLTPVSVASEGGTTTAAFNLAEIGALLRAFEEATGVKVGTYYVDVTAATGASATVAGVPTAHEAVHTLSLKGDASMLQLWDGGRGTAEALNPVDEVKVAVSRTAPRTLSILGFEVRASAARAAGTGLAATALILLGAAAAAALEFARRPEAARVKALVAGKVVEVRAVEHEGEVIELTSMNDLRRIAGSRPILLTSLAGRPCYLVSDGVAWYSYTPREDEEATDAAGERNGPQAEGPSAPGLQPHS